MSQNYFNTLSLRKQLQELSRCRFMTPSEFNGVDALNGKKIIIVGCGAQGLHQGLNLRDSGLDVSYALRKSAINEKRQSWKNAFENGFYVAGYEELVPKADLLINLTPDKQHNNVIQSVMPLMKKNACLSYSHGFNIVEEGMEIRKDITVIMVAPKSPGTELREEYLRDFGVPTLIAVHGENDPENKGMKIAKAYACGIGGDRAGVLHSSFTAEVKSDLMGEQTILCGVLQTGSLLCYDKMVENNIASEYASKLVQYGWETITEALKHGGVTNMMNRLTNPAKIKAYKLSEEIKTILQPMFNQHMDDIMSGRFSKTMMQDWADNDTDLLKWRRQTFDTGFEKSVSMDDAIPEQEFFDNGILMTAFIKAGVELAFDTMVATGIGKESAYYESLHELPLIANLVARKKLYEMNLIISDTAEYGCYLFNHKALPLLKDKLMNKIDTSLIGQGLDTDNNGVDNIELIRVNEAINNTDVEKTGKKLRKYMIAMKQRDLI